MVTRVVTMSKFDQIFSKIDVISMPKQPENGCSCSVDSNKYQILQYKLNNEIHKQFHEPYINKLYCNPKWTERAFWIAVCAVEDILMIDIKDVLQATREYLIQNELPVPSIDWNYWIPGTNNQRDNMKLIRNACLPGITEQDLTIYAKGIDISHEQLIQMLLRMKQDGTIFEQPGGLLKYV